MTEKIYSLHDLIDAMNKYELLKSDLISCEA